MSAKVLVLAGYGLNCEEETLHGFEHAGLSGQIRHINDLIENPKELETAEILAIPGGFSYGDDTGAGNAYCGGFLTGWVSSGSLVQAAAQASVSAAMTIEQIGPRPLQPETLAEAQARTQAIQPLIQPLV